MDKKTLRELNEFLENHRGVVLKQTTNMGKPYYELVEAEGGPVCVLNMADNPAEAVLDYFRIPEEIKRLLSNETR